MRCIVQRVHCVIVSSFRLMAHSMYHGRLTPGHTTQAVIALPKCWPYPFPNVESRPLQTLKFMASENEKRYLDSEKWFNHRYSAPWSLKSWKIWRARGARACNVGLRAKSPAGYRGRTPIFTSRTSGLRGVRGVWGVSGVSEGCPRCSPTRTKSH